jgi:hypothetical protein
MRESRVASRRLPTPPLAKLINKVFKTTFDANKNIDVYDQRCSFLNIPAEIENTCEEYREERAGTSLAACNGRLREMTMRSRKNGDRRDRDHSGQEEVTEQRAMFCGVSGFW